MEFVTEITKSHLETEKRLHEIEYELKTAAITKIKLEYGKDLDRYKFLYTKYRSLLGEFDRAIPREDIAVMLICREEIEETMEDIHRIHVRLNEQLCAMYNTLPG